MRSAKVIVCLLFVCYSFSYGQRIAGEKQHFIELNQFVTGSGFSSSTELSVKISNDDKKTLTIGAFYCYDTDKISGITFKHEIRIFRGKSILKDRVKPHVFYNMIYRRSSIEKTRDDGLTESQARRYISMEHHLGVGSTIYFTKSLFISGDLGFGPYLGSIKKPKILNQYSGEIAGTNGFGMLLKVGIGCNIF